MSVVTKSHQWLRACHASCPGSSIKQDKLNNSRLRTRPSSSPATHSTMDRLRRTVGALLFLLLLPFSFALKFDIQAHPGHESERYERCIRNFVAKDQLVVVTAIVDGHRGDGQSLNVHVRESHGCGRGERCALIICHTDQGHSRKRVWEAKGRDGDQPIRVHVSR